MIYFIVPGNDKEAIESVLWRMPPSTRSRIEIVSYPDFLTAGSSTNGAYIFGNSYILKNGQLEYTERKLAELQRIFPTLKVLNSPSRAVGRFQLLGHLHTMGINDFRAYRATEIMKFSPRFPVFIRDLHRHDGSLTPLLRSQTELERALIRLNRGQGLELEQLLVIEYCHTADDDGIFRKYSALKIGEEILAQCIYFSDHWEVKYSEERNCGHRDRWSDEDLVAEEMRYLEQNPHRSLLGEIFQIAGVQYGRVDYSLLGGRPQIWEINTHPSYAGKETRPGSGICRFQQLRAPVKEHFFSRMFSALESLDVQARPGEVVEISVPEEIRIWAKRSRTREKRSQRIQRVLRMIRRLPGTGHILSRVGGLRSFLSRMTRRDR